jgi:hypothetical protein
VGLVAPDISKIAARRREGGGEQGHPRRDQPLRILQNIHVELGSFDPYSRQACPQLNRLGPETRTLAGEITWVNRAPAVSDQTAAAPTPAECDLSSHAPKRPPIRKSKLPGARESHLVTTRRWLRERRPSHVKRPACNQRKGQTSRQGSRRPCEVKLSETPAVWRLSQRQNEATRSRSLAMTSGLSLCLTTNDQRQRLTLTLRFLRWSTVVHLKVEGEPSWLATSSATNSNPASVGSGG